MLHIINKGLGNILMTPFTKKPRLPDTAFVNTNMKIIYLQPHIFSFSFLLISPLLGEVLERAVLASAAPLSDSLAQRLGVG